MKINWNENPLRTTIDLNDADKRELWLKIKIKIMEDEHLFEAFYHLEEGKNFDLEKARLAVNEDYLFKKTGDNKKTKLDRTTDKHFDWYLEALSEEHVGDCTCVPCTCTKCLAEDLVGVNTIEGLRKHEASKVSGAFADDRNIHEAVIWLATHDPDASADADPASWKHRNPEMWAGNLPRWRQEQVRAHAWLVKYRDEHFAAAA
jgi:hypothetical protein